MLQFKIKPFKELSAEELYQLLQLRSEVFVVEQNCVYQDVDGKDQKALHVLGLHENNIVAYCRLFDAGDYFETPSIGRVVIAARYRDRKWGHSLMQQALKAIHSSYNTTQVTISAQLYLKKFYESHGFIQQGEQYPEDGIPHIRMRKE